MEGHISETSLKRLPAVVRAMDEQGQKVYIYLRLRKSPKEISSRLGISVDEAGELIAGVRHQLAGAGLLDLVEDPRYVSMHSDDPDAPEITLPSGEMGLEGKLIIGEFIRHMRNAVNGLPAHQAMLLRLRYRHGLSAKDILGFSRRTKRSPVPDKDPGSLKEQDIFYAVNSALRDVLKKLKEIYRDAGSFGPEELKYIFEEIGP